MWHLKQALSDSVLHQQPVAVLYLDLDGLKPVNDQHGHDVGDAMLEITARRLCEAVPADTVVSRLGGDEFVCLLKHANNRQELSTLARALIEAVSAELHIGDRHVAVRPSIGIAISQADGATPEVLLKHADAAMYRAKRSHAGCVFWDDH
jgi:diguanylate cyclase (GGDEF)-like protein